MLSYLPAKNMPMSATISPRRYAPPSPRKILPLGKTKTKKPNVAPDTTVMI